jgi:hypothetical protein
MRPVGGDFCDSQTDSRQTLAHYRVTASESSLNQFSSLSLTDADEMRQANDALRHRIDDDRQVKQVC